jgi:hypothetical protein
VGAEAILIWIAIGSALLPLYAIVTATVFCRRALRDGGEFEAEIKAPTRTVRLRAKGPTRRNLTDTREGSEHGSASSNLEDTGKPQQRH